MGKAGGESLEWDRKGMKLGGEGDMMGQEGCGRGGSGSGGTQCILSPFPVTWREKKCPN